MMMAIILTSVCAACAYDTDGNNDRLSSASSSIFSPGYINAAKYQTEAILGQLDPKKSFMERLIENIKGNVADNVDKTANTKATVEIKKKASSASASKKVAVINQPGLVDSVYYNISIGSGGDKKYVDPTNPDQLYDAPAPDRVLASEVINGKRHIYVGFDNYGYYSSSIDTAIYNASASDIIVLKGGEWSYYNISKNINKDISIMGGFDENGNRHWDPVTKNFEESSTIYGIASDSYWYYQYLYIYNTNNTVIDGIVFGGYLNLYLYETGATIYNCRFEDSAYLSIYGLDSSKNILISNNYFGSSSYGIAQYGVSGTTTIAYNTFYSYNAVYSWDYYDPTTLYVTNNNFYTSAFAFETVGCTTIYSYNNNFFCYWSMRNDENGGFTWSMGDYFDYGLYSYGPNIVTYFAEYYNNNASPTFGNQMSIVSGSSENTVNNLLNTNLLTQDLYTNSIRSDLLEDNSYGFKYKSAISYNNLGSTLRTLLSTNDSLTVNMGGSLSDTAISHLIAQALKSAIAIPNLTATELNYPEIRVALALAKILKNPIADQKLLIDTVINLLNDISNAEGESGKSKDMIRAENDLLQIVAGVLLAQGIPDLLKEGDIDNLKGMFKDLGVSKDRVLLDYKESIRPYYNNIVKEIAANLGILETKGIIKKKLTEEELKKLEPREIDRIMDNIRKNNDKSFELEYLLQQDSKYRKEYLEPSKKLMEDHMKDVLGVFTKKLREVLEE